MVKFVNECECITQTMVRRGYLCNGGSRKWGGVLIFNEIGVKYHMPKPQGVSLVFTLKDFIQLNSYNLTTQNVLG